MRFGSSDAIDLISRFCCCTKCRMSMQYQWKTIMSVICYFCGRRCPSRHAPNTTNKHCGQPTFRQLFHRTLRIRSGSSWGAHRSHIVLPKFAGGLYRLSIHRFSESTFHGSGTGNGLESDVNQATFPPYGNVSPVYTLANTEAIEGPVVATEALFTTVFLVHGEASSMLCTSGRSLHTGRRLPSLNPNIVLEFNNLATSMTKRMHIDVLKSSMVKTLTIKLEIFVTGSSTKSRGPFVSAEFHPGMSDAEVAASGTAWGN